jgi:uncharacterized protein
MTKPDLRSLPSAELRVEDAGGKPRIVGYAAVFNSLSEDLGGFREVVRPGAFAACLKDADVRALVNHDPARVLGRTRSGTCKLVEDSRGLRYEIDPPDTTYCRDLLESIRRGDISGSSFRFYMHADPNRGQMWRSEPSGVVREITEFGAVDDVSVVTYPAYAATEVSVRSLDAYHAIREGRPADPWLLQAEVDLALAEAS